MRGVRDAPAEKCGFSPPYATISLFSPHTSLSGMPAWFPLPSARGGFLIIKKGPGTYH